MICQVVGGVDETETDGEFRRCGFATRLPALAFQPRGVVGPAFPTLHFPHSSLSVTPRPSRLPPPCRSISSSASLLITPNMSVWVLCITLELLADVEPDPPETYQGPGHPSRVTRPG